MSPKPKLFLVEMEVTMRHTTSYYVFAHSEIPAAEKASEVMAENVRNGWSPVVFSDDVNIQFEDGKPLIKDIKFIGFKVSRVSEPEETIEQDS